MLYGNTAGNTYPHYTYNALLQGANTNGTGLYFVWKSFYKGINACNTAIGRMPLSPLADDLKLVREAEARFLRAFYYYHLVEIFGPIPLRLKETEAPELTATRASVDDVYKQIIEDLTFALYQSEWQGNPCRRKSYSTGRCGFAWPAYTLPETIMPML